MSQRDSSATVEVKGYRIVGNTAFEHNALVHLVEGRTGKLTLTALDAAAQEISHYYREHGYLVARAYIPEQEIQNGIIAIAILEGRYDHINVSNESRLSDTRVERTVQNPICDKPDCKGSLVEAGSLERGLLLLSDTPGVIPSSQVGQGSLIGTSSLEVQTRSTPLFRGVAEVSNYGNHYTGATRVAGTLVADSPFHFGDQFLLQAVGSGHEAFGGAQYSVPLNYSGTRLAVRFNMLDYGLAGQFEPLDSHGIAQTVEASLTHPFIRRSNTNVMGTLTFGRSLLKDYVGLTSSSNPRSILDLVGQIDANHVDKWLGTTGYSAVSVTFTEGDLHFKNPANALFDEFTAHTGGYFNKLNYSVSRLQTIAPRWAVFALFQQQITTRNLDSFEKFFLGGPTAVRAYAVGEAAGDRGFLGTAELRWRPPGTLFGGSMDVAALYDHGVSHINSRPHIAGPNERELHGPGVRLGWTQERGITLGATFAFRGTEQFQSIPDSPFTAWLYASYRF